MNVRQEDRMSTPQSSGTAERAYLIWEHMGRPEGQALEHWLKGRPARGQVVHAVSFI